jgi:hypothetical protein
MKKHRFASLCNASIYLGDIFKSQDGSSVGIDFASMEKGVAGHMLLRKTIKESYLVVSGVLQIAKKVGDKFEYKNVGPGEEYFLDINTYYQTKNISDETATFMVKTSPAYEDVINEKDTFNDEIKLYVGKMPFETTKKRAWYNICSRN